MGSSVKAKNVKCVRSGLNSNSTETYLIKKSQINFGIFYFLIHHNLYIFVPVMKKIIAAACLLVLVSCNNGGKEGEIGTDAISNSESAHGKVSTDMPEMTFDEEVFDFGKITQGEKVSHSFTFKNTGNKNLIISNAEGSCGCTIPEWPKEPILPNGTGKINVVFNSEGKSGMMEKTVTIITNCEPATRIIRIKTEIIVAEATH